MRLAFGSDHAGYALRTALEQWAREQGHDVSHFGAESEEPYDYPDAADLVTKEVLQNRADFGVLCCGTGIGISIRANRYRGIRAANCTSTQMAELARQHNHANILCVGARITTEEDAKQILRKFLETDPDTAERHARRVQKLDNGVC